MSANPTRLDYDFEELFVGAIKGWAVGSACFVAWALSTPCACELGLVGMIVVFEIALSLWFLGAVVVLGVPCFELLRRLRVQGSAGAWFVVGFAVFGFGVAAFSVFVKKDVALAEGWLLVGLAAISGGFTFFFARKQAAE